MFCTHEEFGRCLLVTVKSTDVTKRHCTFSFRISWGFFYFSVYFVTLYFEMSCIKIEKSRRVFTSKTSRPDCKYELFKSPNA